MFEDASHLWVVHISNDEKSAQRAQQEGFVCIGWTKMGDLSKYDSREKTKAAMQRAYPSWSDGKVNSSYGQVYRFARKMQMGDPVVYPVKGSREIMIGKIAGDYRWANDDSELVAKDYCNVRPVNWLKTVPRIVFSSPALHSFGSFSSVSTSDEHLEEVVAVLSAEKDVGLSNVTGAVTPAKAGTKGDGVNGTSNAQESSDAGGGPGEPDVPNLAERAIEETKDYLLRQWARSAQDFEDVVAAVFRAMSYTATVQQGTHDLGVDVVAHPDPLGVEPPLLKIQCKSGTGTTGAPAIKQLRGLLNEREKGIIIGLGGFSNDARHVQQNDADLVLIDGDRFVELFLDHYDRLAPEWRHRFPLTRVYVATG